MTRTLCPTVGPTVGPTVALAALLATALAPSTACRALLPRPVAVNLDVNAPAELPAQFRDAFVLVELRIDGQTVAPFLLDTGSDISAVDVSVARQIGLAPESSAIARGTSGSVSTSIVRGNRLDAGPLHVESPVFLVLDLSEFEWVIGERLGGILGLDLLREVALTVDVPAQRVELTPGGSGGGGIGIAPRGARLPLRTMEGLCGVDVELDGSGPLTLLIDTGMSTAVSIGEDEARTRNLRGPDGRRPAPWHVGIAGSARVPAATFDRLRVGGRTLRAVDVVFEKPAGSFAGAIGSGALRFFRYTLDVSGGTLELSDASPARDLDPSRRGAGLWCDPVERGLRVLAVFESSPAARAGVRAGDLIVRVDGRAIFSGGGRALRRWSPANGDVLRLTLADDGADREVALGVPVER